METTLSVPGISCEHCQISIEGAVGAMDGVERVAVAVAEKTVTLSYAEDRVSLPEIVAAIEEQGYEVV